MIKRIFKEISIEIEDKISSSESINCENKLSKSLFLDKIL